MNHPELLLIPTLMLLDYFLTIWGAAASESPYRKHFRLETYEMNPLWKKTVDQKRWFNIRYLLGVALMSVYCLYLSSVWIARIPVIEGLFGGLLVFFGCVTGAHLSNILMFYYIKKNPTGVAGEVTLSHEYSLRISGYRYVVVLVPMALTVMFVRVPFVIGGLMGVLVIIAVHLIWQWRYNVKCRREK